MWRGSVECVVWSVDRVCGVSVYVESGVWSVN